MNRRVSLATKVLRGKFIPFLLPYWDGREQEIIQAWLKGERFPKAVAKLEDALSAKYGPDVAVRAVNSGRSAIQLALESLRLPAKSEVILPSFGCTGTIVPIMQAGLSPVLADCDEHFNLSAATVEAAHSENVRVVLLPHLSGCWARDTEQIIDWAHKQDVVVIEDCAQSLDLKVKDRFAGLWGDMAVFSTRGGKQIMNTGGGWVISRLKKAGDILRSTPLADEPHDAVEARVKDFYRHFRSPAALGIGYLAEAGLRKILPGRGMPSACSDDYAFQVQAPGDIESQLILIQLGKIDEINTRRQENAAFWRHNLEVLGLQTLRIPPQDDNVFTKMLLSFDGSGAEQEATALRSRLSAAAIETEASYTPLHLREPFSRTRRTEMPVTERLYRHAFSVPVRPNLTAEQLEHIQNSLQAK